MPAAKWSRRNYLKTIFATMGAAIGSQVMRASSPHPRSQEVPVRDLSLHTELAHGASAEAMKAGNRSVTPLSAELDWAAADVANVKAFGAYGDGSSHVIGAEALAKAQARFPLTHAAYRIT